MKEVAITTIADSMADSDLAEYKPFEILHPGEILLEYLEYYGWCHKDLARNTGINVKTIHEICNGKTSITPPISLAFEKVLRRPAHFWLNLQHQYDESVARDSSTKI